MKSRHFILALLLSLFLAPVFEVRAKDPNASGEPRRTRLSVNAYSFNEQLRSGEMTLSDMMEYAAETGLDAVDLTGYYFGEYPKVSPDEELFALKRKALSLGIDISWTGIRNNFVTPDSVSRENDRKLIEDWIVASSKLGSPVMRVFAGKGSHEGYSRNEVKAWMVEELKQCAIVAQEHGVILALQNHNDFLFTSEDILEVLHGVDSDYLGLNLDIGCLRTSPYEEFEKLLPHATYIFIKDTVYFDGVPEPIDLRRVMSIIQKSDYSGYLSLEVLREPKPKEALGEMLQSLRRSEKTAKE